MSLRWGFKSEATELAAEVRAELSLNPFDRLDPHKLAAHLAIPIESLTDIATTCLGARHFLSVEPEAFSAVTVFDGSRRIIVHNDSHSDGRQNSNLAHELAHGLLLHSPLPALDDLTGCRHWNSISEEEANWLGGELLVTRPTAIAVARGRWSTREACHRLGVSSRMLEWRLSMTGARKQVERERRRTSGRRPARDPRPA